jgi:glycogen synthase
MFFPSIGGLETVVSILAHEFMSQSHEVKVVSVVPDSSSRAFPFEVVRRPSAKQLLSLTRWCDIYFMANVSLKGLWPLFFLRRPLVVNHNGWYTRSNGRTGWQDRLKLIVSRFSTNISVSRAVAEHLPVLSTIIPNPYPDDIFRTIEGIRREYDLVFLGRLVSDKGVDLLLSALKLLKEDGLTPSLTIIGGGPEENALREQRDLWGMQDQVRFLGQKTGQELVEVLSAHRIMVVPSRWQEPFGVVALEGIACGCVVVGSEGGGLKDAIGPCGLTFANGDAKSLAKILTTLLQPGGDLSVYTNNGEAHLLRHQSKSVASAYLHVFENTLSRNGSNG